MIEVENLSKQYGDIAAVSEVSFFVPAGQTLALVGTSGCGKTTTLKMINRLVEPSRGRIVINGQDVLSVAPELLRRKIGYVIQHIGLFPHFTIEENVALVPKLLEWAPERIRRTVVSLLDRLQLPAAEFLHRYPHQLSGGQQQRVGIARALAGDPPIILMDEPFGALDPITRHDIRRDFRELPELSGKTVIIVTHDIEEAFEMADQICLLDQGRIQQFDDPKGLLFRPKNDFVRKFLADKQLQLELRAVRIRDLFEQLPALSGSRADLIEIDPDLSIFGAMARFTREGIGSARTELAGTHKRYNLHDLIQIFQVQLMAWRKL